MTDQTVSWDMPRGKPEPDQAPAVVPFIAAVPALPEPLTPPDSDLRRLPFLPLHKARLQQSRTWHRARRIPFLGFCVINLWLEAWHAIPAGSLDDDDEYLRDIAECSEKNWEAMRSDALSGFVKCSDGRLYHTVIAEIAKETWQKKKAIDTRMKKARLVKDSLYNRANDSPVIDPETGDIIDPMTNTMSGLKHKHKYKGKEEEEKTNTNLVLPDSVSRERAPLMPSRYDAPHKWMHLAQDGARETDLKGVTHALVGGYYPEVVVDLVLTAARINDVNFRGDWRPVLAWLRDGFVPSETILPAIREVADRDTYEPAQIKSLAYFDRAVRSYRRQS